MSQKIHVFVDTSVLPTDPAHRGLGFENLSQLAQAKLAQVYISEVAKDEWFSHMSADWRALLRDSRRATRKLTRNPWSRLLNEYDKISEGAEALQLDPNEISEVARRASSELLALLSAKVISISGDHARSAFERYFGGNPPFAQERHKEDLPDAFIYEAGLEISRELSDPLHCVVADKRLGKAFDQQANIVLHKSLTDFARSELAQTLVKQLKLASAWATAKTQIWPKLNLYEAAVTSQLDDILGDTAAGETVSHEQIPADNNEATVLWVEGSYDTEIDWENAQDFGPGIIEVRFSTNAIAELWFAVFRSEIFEVPNGVSVDIWEPLNRHYHDAEGSGRVAIQGSLSLTIDTSNLESTELPELEQVGIGDIESIEVIEDDQYEIFNAVR